jgi:hypothetical protein
MLLVFVALGTFVYALAVGGSLTGFIGAGLIALMIATVAGFRVGARIRAESNDSGITIEGANVWVRPLRRDQIDQYLLTYRGVRSGAEESRSVDSMHQPTYAEELRAA